MITSRILSVIAGGLLILSTVAGILSIVPAIDAPDYLFKASEDATRVLFGALFQIIMATAYVGIAITLYPVLRKYNESLALGFLGFRIVAAVFIIIGVVSLPLLLELSRGFAKAGAPDSSHFQILGNLLRTGRDFVNHVAMVLALGAGGLMFYFLLYQEKLTPRWLSSWGLIGTTLSMSASLLLMFRLTEVISTTYLILNLPMALQEMVLAVWLMAKGFDPSALALAPPKRD